jgi:hypothetical protein
MLAAIRLGAETALADPSDGINATLETASGTSRASGFSDVDVLAFQGAEERWS